MGKERYHRKSFNGIIIIYSHDISEKERDDVEPLIPKWVFRCKGTHMPMRETRKREISTIYEKDLFDFHQFKTPNRFQILEDIEDYEIHDIIEKVNVIKIPRRKLKKCRFCNYKKRACIMNPLSCKAKQCACFSPAVKLVISQNQKNCKSM